MELGFLLWIRSLPKMLFLIIRLAVGEGLFSNHPRNLLLGLTKKRKESVAGSESLAVGSRGTPWWEIMGVHVLTWLW